jgi:hypothetical protein
VTPSLLLIGCILLIAAFAWACVRFGARPDFGTAQERHSADTETAREIRRITAITEWQRRDAQDRTIHTSIRRIH